MNLTHLLTQEVERLAASTGADDDYGNAVAGFTPAGTFRCRLEQRRGEERTNDRDTQLSDWALYLSPDVVTSGRDRWVDAYGRTFEQVGPANMRSTPTGPGYVEVSLRHVEG